MTITYSARAGPTLQGACTGQKEARGVAAYSAGQIALGIRVVDFSSGGPIGYGRGVVRYLGRIISGIVFLLGYLWMLWDKEKQTWHEKVATTVVVPVQDFPVS